MLVFQYCLSDTGLWDCTVSYFLSCFFRSKVSWFVGNKWSSYTSPNKEVFSTVFRATQISCNFFTIIENFLLFVLALIILYISSRLQLFSNFTQFLLIPFPNIFFGKHLLILRELSIVSTILGSEKKIQNQVLWRLEDGAVTFGFPH